MKTINSILPLFLYNINPFITTDDNKSFKDFAKKLSIAWGGQDITKDDYDYEKYYNDYPDEAYENLRLIQMGKAPHFRDDGKSGMYKKLSHPTYPDLGDRSWSENDTVFNISDRQVAGDTDRILNYLGGDLQYNNGGTKVKYNEGIVLPTLTVTPNARWTELVPNKYHTGWVYPDSRAADPNVKPFEYIVPKTVDKHIAPVITKTPLYYGDDWIYNMLP